MIIRYTKARHLSAEDTQDIEATLASKGDNLQWTWEAGDLVYQRAIELLKSGDISLGEIAEEFGVSKSTIHRWKKRAQKENKL